MPYPKETPIEDLIDHFEQIRKMNAEHMSGRDLVLTDAVFVTLINQVKKRKEAETKLLKEAYEAGIESKNTDGEDGSYQTDPSNLPFEKWLEIWHNPS